MWVTKMFGYDCKIIYKKGRENLVPNALSRKYEDDGFLFSLSLVFLGWIVRECNLSLKQRILEELHS